MSYTKSKFISMSNTGLCIQIIFIVSSLWTAVVQQVIVSTGEVSVVEVCMDIRKWAITCHSCWFVLIWGIWWLGWSNWDWWLTWTLFPVIFLFCLLIGLPWLLSSHIQRAFALAFVRIFNVELALLYLWCTEIITLVLDSWCIKENEACIEAIC